MCTILKEVELLLEFQDKVIKVDSYIQNYIYNKLKLDRKRVCPKEAFSSEKPPINYIRVQGYKYYYYKNKKSQSKHNYINKLINPRRVSVFIGYIEEIPK